MNFKIMLTLILSAAIVIGFATSQSRNYDNTSAYLDRQVVDAPPVRDDYWHRDYSSIDNYVKGIEPYRQDFASMFGIPPECRRGVRPGLIEQRHVADLDGISIDYWLLAVCAGELEQQVLVATPADSRGTIIAFYGTSGSPEIDYLETGSLGTYGISLGDLISFYLAAIDRRVDVAVVSAYIEDRDGKQAGPGYQDAYWTYENADYIIIPGLLNRFDDADMASLIVSRPLFVEVGQKARVMSRVWP